MFSARSPSCLIMREAFIRFFKKVAGEILENYILQVMLEIILINHALELW